MGMGLGLGPRLGSLLGLASLLVQPVALLRLARVHLSRCVVRLGVNLLLLNCRSKLNCRSEVNCHPEGALFAASGSVHLTPPSIPPREVSKSREGHEFTRAARGEYRMVRSEERR